MRNKLAPTRRIRRATFKKNSRGCLYDCYPRWCTNREAPQVLETCFFLQFMTQNPRLTQVDIGKASENVAKPRTTPDTISVAACTVALSEKLEEL